MLLYYIFFLPLHDKTTDIAVDLDLVKALTPCISDSLEAFTINLGNAERKCLLCSANYSFKRLQLQFLCVNSTGRLLRQRKNVNTDREKQCSSL